MSQSIIFNHKKNHHFVFFLVVLFAAFNAFAVIEVIDDDGSRVSLKQPARKIVSLAPHTTELLFAAGAGQWVVGAVNFSDYPLAAKSIARVGGYQSLDYEKIITLQPDLVVAWQSGNRPANIEKLKKMGIPVFVTEARKLDDIPVLLEKISRLTDTQAQAKKIINQYQQHLSSLRRLNLDKKKISVFFQIWQHPLMTVNSEHLINQVINLCGGVNIFTDMKMLSGSVGIEDILLKNPEVIMINGRDERFKNWGSSWSKWKKITAVKNNHVFQVNPDTMSRHSPRILSGADEVCGILDSVR
ncbi:MAG: cobalamin-binding protein [Gammaproteobacteria bacterium]|nr:cobalamin-binding protein [Gammaproteobacteria bacterium]